MSTTTEILATPVATVIPRPLGSFGFEITNNGPESIWVAIGQSGISACQVGKCREIKPGRFWSVASESSSDAVFIRTTSAPQVTGAGTVFIEIF